MNKKKNKNKPERHVVELQWANLDEFKEYIQKHYTKEDMKNKTKQEVLSEVMEHVKFKFKTIPVT